MENNTTPNKVNNLPRSRKIALVIAVLLAFSPTIAGTYAFISYRNISWEDSDGLRYSADLVSNFNHFDTLHWDTTPERNPVTNEVWVRNSGALDGNAYGDVFVRIQLSEFMEFYTEVDILTSERFMTDNTGSFISAPTESEARDLAVSGAGPLIIREYDVRQVRMYITPFRTNIYSQNSASVQEWLSRYNSIMYTVDPDFTPLSLDDVTYFADGDTLEETRLLHSDFFIINPSAPDAANDNELPWYIMTQAGGRDGVYGSFIVIDVAPNKSTTEPLVSDGTFTIRTWQDGLNSFNPDVITTIPNETFNQYIQLGFGNDVILYENWLAEGSNSGPFWIVDTTDMINGWVYWGESIIPQHSTTNFIETMRLLQQPDKAFYYALDTEMQAAAFVDLNTWLEDADISPGAPDIIGAIMDAHAPIQITIEVTGPQFIFIGTGNAEQLQANVFIDNDLQTGHAVTWEIASVYVRDDISSSITPAALQAVRNSITVNNNGLLSVITPNNTVRDNARGARITVIARSVEFPEVYGSVLVIAVLNQSDIDAKSNMAIGMLSGVWNLERN